LKILKTFDWVLLKYLHECFKHEYFQFINLELNIFHDFFLHFMFEDAFLHEFMVFKFMKSIPVLKMIFARKFLKNMVLLWSIFMHEKYVHDCIYHFWNGFGVFYKFIKVEKIEMNIYEIKFSLTQKKWISPNNWKKWISPNNRKKVNIPFFGPSFFNFIKHLSQEIFSFKTDFKCFNPTQNTFVSVKK
jgi:hypothetical protein